VDYSAKLESAKSKSRWYVYLVAMMVILLLVQTVWFSRKQHPEPVTITEVVHGDEQTRVALLDA
jgi:hypothetical protein